MLYPHQAAASVAATAGTSGRSVPSVPPTGGGFDMVARLMGQWLSERFGQPLALPPVPAGAAALSAHHHCCRRAWHP